MKYCRFKFENQTRYGAVEERGGELWIVDLPALPKKISPPVWHLATTSLPPPL